jgi:hypothetical protein
MSFLKKLFGGGAAKPEEKPAGAEPVHHKGFDIIADPIREGSVYRIAARIEKDVDGERRSQRMVRADTTNILEEAVETSVFKAKQVIDQQGEGLFQGQQV